MGKINDLAVVERTGRQRARQQRERDGEQRSHHMNLRAIGRMKLSMT
jgi:hypothetical protein